MKRTNFILITTAIAVIIVVVIIIISTKHSNSTSSASNVASSAFAGNYEAETLQRSQVKLTLELFKAWQASEEKNLLLSPLSLSIGFAMLLLGAERESEQQIFKALYFNETVDVPDRVHPVYHHILEDLQLRNADEKGAILVKNKIFYDQRLQMKSRFENELKKYYGSEAEKTDFESATSTDAINRWVKMASNGKIAKLFDEQLDASTRLVLLNVIFFAKFWLDPFEEKFTAPKKFSISNSRADTIDLPTMYKRAKYRYAENDDLKYQLLEIPYSLQNLNCYVVLPDKQQPLQTLIEKLSDVEFEKSVNALRTREIQLLMPKFKLESSLDMREPMQRLGLVDIFDGRADLAKISEQKNLQVSKTVHKALIEFSEKGTEGSAATGIAVEARSGRISMKFSIDRPFLFFIRNNQTGVVYFAGRVYQPQAL